MVEHIEIGQKAERRCGMSAAGWIVFGIIEALVLLGAWFAYCNDMLTARQMLWHQKHGLPYLWHFGMVGDALIMAPLCGYIAAQYGGDWSGYQVGTAMLVGICASALMHYVWLKGTVYEANMHDGMLTPSGWTHVVNMAVIVAVLVLFVFFSHHVPNEVVMAAVLLIAVHVIFGTHVVLGIINPPWWYAGEPFDNPLLLRVLATCGVLGIIGVLYLIR
ncbi:MAG TPA: hypothetical protein VF803_02830 [Candidatus Paceibacterota bacterium]